MYHKTVISRITTPLCKRCQRDGHHIQAGLGLIDKNTGADRIPRNTRSNNFSYKLVLLNTLFWKYRVAKFIFFLVFS